MRQRRGGGRTDEGVVRRGPILTTPSLYPYNPRLPSQRGGSLNNTLEQPLVAFNRIFNNFWVSRSVCHVDNKGSDIIVSTYSESMRRKTEDSIRVDPNTLKAKIIEMTDTIYFPPELLKDHYSLPKQFDHPAYGSRRRVAKVTTEDGQEEQEQSGNEADEGGSDFGGEDYAHDHYADEDREELDDAGGGDGDVF